MGEGQVSTQELVAGRYRPLDVVQQEEGRTSWHGEDIEFGRPVLLTAAQLPPPPREGNARRTTARILRESEALALMCPGQVPAVLDVVEENDVVWTVTDPVPGTGLVGIIEHGPVNHLRAARLALAVLDVLEAAHRRGVTHGDLSPGQVYVQDDGGVVVTGFGLVATSPVPRVTAPAYASPEQARGESAGPAADQWALGAMLYALVEGRPPVRDRGTVEATLRAVDRLPLRPPANAGPLVPAITALLRHSPLERVPEPVVRDNLVRLLDEDQDDDPPEAWQPNFLAARLAARRAILTRWPVRRSVLLGAAALAVAASSVAVYAATDGDGTATASGPSPTRSRATPSADASSAAAPAPGTTATATKPPATPGKSPTRSTSPSTTPSRSPGASTKPPAGFTRYDAPEGFSIDLPKGFERVLDQRGSDGSYRVTFGADDDPRRLAVTYSKRLGTDPVAVWQELEAELKLEFADFRRVGDITTLTYQGYPGADMQWLATEDGVLSRTFGRGYIVGDGKGFSVRWTAPEADWDSAANQQALRDFLRSLRATPR
ncbi:serine/threonine protein kinase [Actinobacteria bacterium OK074]|nr:serine/threonine protein kinase [Actinobacteria bacterium OK074]